MNRTSEAFRRRTQEAMRAAAIAALGWEPEPPRAYQTGDDYAATTGELLHWLAETHRLFTR